jgi:hypothetical protein
MIIFLLLLTSLHIYYQYKKSPSAQTTQDTSFGSVFVSPSTFQLVLYQKKKYQGLETHPRLESLGPNGVHLDPLCDLHWACVALRWASLTSVGRRRPLLGVVGLRWVVFSLFFHIYDLNLKKYTC